jgi:hypothetical protein
MYLLVIFIILFNLLSIELEYDITSRIYKKTRKLSWTCSIVEIASFNNNCLSNISGNCGFSY